jgi:Flp pilus assembly pilin Flp
LPPSDRNVTALLPHSHIIILGEGDVSQGQARTMTGVERAMKDIVKGFVRDEDGAVTVDFVVLTAGVIGLCMLFILPVLAEAVNWGEAIGDVAQRNLGE